MLPPETYTPALLAEIVPRVLELIYTAWDMQPFARDLGFDGPPFAWNEVRRALLRADLDGIYAHLYGLDRDDFAHVLDTFPIMNRKDRARFGEERTKRLSLEAYDYYARDTRIALRTDVEQIELKLRALVVSVLGQSTAAVPPRVLEKLAEQWQKKAGSGDLTKLPLSVLLEASYLMNLKEIMVAPANWQTFEAQFGRKSEFESRFWHLNALRNALAHPTELIIPGKTRQDGEQAVRWFQQVLGLYPAKSGEWRAATVRPEPLHAVG